MDAEHMGRKRVTVTLDPRNLRSFMELWKGSADVRLPMDDALKIHFIAKRREILSNCELTAAAWLMAFDDCEAEDGHRTELDGLVREIREFRDWAKSGIAEFGGLGRSGSE